MMDKYLSDKKNKSMLEDSGVEGLCGTKLEGLSGTKKEGVNEPTPAESQEPPQVAIDPNTAVLATEAAKLFRR